MVVVPEFNDDFADVQKRMELVKSLGGCVERVDILPYHTLGRGKYKGLGMDYPINVREEISDDYWKEFCKIADNVGLKIHIAGRE